MININDIGIGTVIEDSGRDFVVLYITTEEGGDVITGIDSNGDLVIAKLILDNCFVKRIDYIDADSVDVLKAYRELRKIVVNEEMEVKGYITL